MRRWHDEIPSLYFPDWESVVIIGEYTTSAGPYYDDHFLVLIERDGSEYDFASHTVSSIASHLQRITPEPIRFGLANRADESSRIIFPPALAEKQLYVWTTNRPTTLWGRLFHFLTLGFFITTNVEWTMDVRRYLGELQSDAPPPPTDGATISQPGARDKNG